MRISASINKNKSIDTFQYGRTAILSYNKAAHSVKATGHDSTGLRHRRWMLFEDKYRHITQIMFAYVPSKSASDRFQTVYNQHKHYLLRQGILGCPQKIMHKQLVQQILQFQEKGENIVFLIGTNENLARMGQLQSKLQ